MVPVTLARERWAALQDAMGVLLADLVENDHLPAARDLAERQHRTLTAWLETIERPD